MLSPEAAVSNPAENRSRRSSAKPPPSFDFDHRLLNQETAGALWSNLGLWTGNELYSEAGEALARRLGERAGLGPDTEVLDAGCGAGDQILLWCREFGVTKVVGCELDPALVRLADRRLAAFGEAHVERTSATELDHFPSQSFDRVLALDCAYHFAPRDQFFLHAQRLLRPGGQLVFTDLALGPLMRRSPGRLCAERMATACQIPASNLASPDELQRRLRQAGLSPAEVVYLDHPVLRGFARHARRHRKRWRDSPTGRKVRATGWLCSLAYWTRSLHYLLIRAEKRLE